MNEKARPDGSEVVEAFCTKYALTTGVYKVRGKVYPVDSPQKPAFNVIGTNGRGYLLFHGEWHTTKEMAAARVRGMSAAKRKSLAASETKLDDIDDDLICGQLPMAKEDP